MNLLRLLTIQGAAQSMAELITDLQLGGSGDADQRLATVARRTRRGVRCHPAGGNHGRGASAD